MVNIGVGTTIGQPPSAQFPSLSLNDDGYYWYLHPLFEKLAAATNQYVDLYGDAIFDGEHLPALEQTLQSARQLIAAQPATWNVHTGTQTHPVHKEVYNSVNRQRFLDLLEIWDRAIAAARTHNLAIVCFGD
jgi:hypothetical protein